MDKPQDISFESLLVKYLLGEAGPEEAQQVEDWLAADPENRRQYDAFRLIWEKSLLLNAAAPHALNEEQEEERAWQALLEKMHGRELRPRESRRQTARVMMLRVRWTAVAALLILGVALSFLWWRRAKPEVWQSTVALDAIRTDTLPDGSMITLNKHATLSHPVAFKANERAVNLEGEAFFRVATDKQRLFKVMTHGITITVLGTSFNVKSGSGATAITVETGAVAVSNGHGTIRLNAGETIAVGQDDSVFEKHSAATPVYEYYRARDLICNDTPLWQLVDALNQAYDAHIVIGNPAIRERPIHTVFHDESLDSVLSVVSETLNIKVVRSGPSIILQ